MKKKLCACVVVSMGLWAGCGKKPPTLEKEAAAEIVARPGLSVPTAKQLAAHAKSRSAEAARRFTTWTPVHAFLSASVADGAVISAKDAIVVTRDNHVGVTTDGGANWSFVRHTSATVRAVAGAPGGPFAAAGGGGYLAVSPDGRTWTELPRHVAEDLVAVAVGPVGIGAVGKNGAFVKTSLTGADAFAGNLPDKVKPSAVFVDAKQFIVTAGKKDAYVSTDGRSWTPVAVTMPTAGGTTSRGVCGLGKVGKRRGVVCTVAGAAYGIDPTDALVIGKSTVALTRDAGATWAFALLPLNGIRGVAGKQGGPYHVYDAKGAIASTSDGGRTWAATTDASVLAGAPAFPAKLAKCSGLLPAAGDACQLVREMTSPADLPDVKAFRFVGDAGIAFGDSALVAMTTDGGATWKAAAGLPLGRLQAFDAHGPRVVVAGSSHVVVSTDGGKSFRAVDLPPKTPALDTVRIQNDGTIFLGGAGGTILQSQGDVASWSRLDTGAKNKTNYLSIHEVEKVLYAAGSRGELHRSADGGKTWTPVATGVGEVVEKMAGQGQTVLAVTTSSRWNGSRLLRSNDGGEHFVVQRELSESGAHELAFKDGVIRYGNLVSDDFGATWSHANDWYFSGSVDVGDGSGVRIANLGGYGGKDRFVVLGPDKDDMTIVDAFFNKGARFACDAASGCWMLAGGQLYHPAMQ